MRVLFLELLFKLVIAKSGTGGTKISSYSLVLQLSTELIRASSSDNTAKKVDNIFKSFNDNSSPKATAKVDAKTI